MDSGTASNTADDLSLAKRALSDESLTLVAAKTGVILFRSRSRGVTDILTMIDQLGSLTEGASLADTVVGRAAALLCVYCKIVAVYGERMSEGAAAIFKANRIRYEHATLVPRILNRDRSDMCPFDKAVLGTEEPNTALQRLKALKLK